MTQILKVEDTRSSRITLAEVSDYEPFKPILDRVLIRRVETATTSKLDMPDKYRQQTNEGEVLEVGDGVYIGGQTLPMPVKIGDLVLFGEYNAERFMKDGVELWLVRVQNIRGVKRLKKPENRNVGVFIQVSKPVEVPCFDTFPADPFPVDKSETYPREGD